MARSFGKVHIPWRGISLSTPPGSFPGSSPSAQPGDALLAVEPGGEPGHLVNPSARDQTGFTSQTPSTATPQLGVSRSEMPAPVQGTNRSLSRRAVVMGLTAAGVTIVAGSGVVLSRIFSQPAHLPPATHSSTPLPVGTTLYTYNRHNQVSAVAWAPNGARIASGSWDTTVQVWDATNGGNVYIYRGHSNHAGAVAWAPNGARIASGSNDGTVQVWEAANGGNVFTYRGHAGTVNAVAWSPDGKRIASGWSHRNRSDGHRWA